MLCLLGRAADTNTVFPIDDGMLVAQNAKGEVKLNRVKIEAAKKLRECLPASEFPEGNWGTVTEGFQLSLRFETNDFTTGTPIAATIILRNVTNSVLNYRAVGILGGTSPIPVVVTYTNGSSVPLKSDDIAVVSVRNVKLFPGTEQKFHERIDSLFNLPTNGLVNVHAELKLERPNNIEIQSASVSITIR